MDAPQTGAICRHSGECGGCTLQHVPYEEQLRQKRERLRALLRGSLGSAAPDVLPVLGCATPGGSGPWGFRHKVSFVFGPGPGPRGLAMGHFAASSNRLVPVAECPVHSMRGNRIAFALRDALAAAGIPPAGPRLEGLLRHVIVRTTADQRQAVAMLVVTRNDKRLRGPVRRFLAGAEAPDGFCINIHDRPGPYMVGRETLVIAGRPHVRETALASAYLISPAAFFQTNVEAASLLLQEVLRAIPARPAGRLLDLYSGSGFFGLALARQGHAVTMIEENAQAVRDAAENVRINLLPPGRIRLVCARAEDALLKGGVRGAPVRDIDAAIIDPPRDGCPERVLAALFAGLRPPTAVYVSCNPDALARELPAIAAAGYDTVRVQPIDMFPHVEHLETVVVLRRRA